MMTVGTVCEIKMAYNMETGCRDIMDEFSCCEAEILNIKADGYVDVWVKGMGEAELHADRLQIRRPV